MGFKRFVAGTTGKFFAGTASALGTAGVAFGDGKGLGGKAADGLEAIVSTPGNYVPNAVELVKAAAGYGQINADLDLLTARQFIEKYGVSPEQIIQGANKTVGDVMQMLGNLYSNVTQQPVETGATAIAYLAAGYLALQMIDLWQNRGQGDFVTRLKRRVGNKFWPDTRSGYNAVPTAGGSGRPEPYGAGR